MNEYYNCISMDYQPAPKNAKISLIITHRNRLQCLLGKLGVTDHVINNMSITKIEVNSPIRNGHNVIIQGLHYLFDERLNHDATQITTKELNTELRVNDDFQFKFSNMTFTDHHIFYVICSRNTIPLTTLINMIRKIDQDLRDLKGKDIPTNKIISEVFVSDLNETFETFEKLKNAVQILKGPDSGPFGFGLPVVLPCSHNVSTVGVDGNCDELTSIFNSYNPSCTIDKINKFPSCTAKWNYYGWFYDSYMRGSMFSKKKRRCRDTNMLLTALLYFEYLKEKNENTRGGSTLKSKKTRKLRSISRKIFN